MVTLRPVSPLDGHKEWQFITAIPQDVNGFSNSFSGKPESEFSDWLMSRVHIANAINLQPEWVPQHSYWIESEDKELIGFLKIRTRLTPSLLDEGGHIGYFISPEQQGKGYGTQALTQGLKKAQLKGIDLVLVTCNAENISSKRVIEKNGGQLCPTSTDTKLKFWIYN